MTVIVEPDDLSAWVGLAGVVVGVIAGAGVSWLQVAARDRRATRQELLSAINELQSAALVFNMLTGTGRMTLPAASGPALPWITAITTSLDRLQQVGSTVRRLGPQEVAMAANKTVKMANELALDRARGEPGSPDTVRHAALAFTSAVERAGL